LFEATMTMLLTILKAKLHRATVTGADMNYEGSIDIDRDLLDLSGILPHEQVDVLNITTGARLTTHAIEAPRGSREIAVNRCGAAGRDRRQGDHHRLLPGAGGGGAELLALGGGAWRRQ
jgi:aspartate 1-decarboxylase